MRTKPNELPLAESESESEIVDEVLAAAGGDPRAAIAGLVRGQRQLEDEIRRNVSAGYARRAPR